MAPTRVGRRRPGAARARQALTFACVDADFLEQHGRGQPLLFNARVRLQGEGLERALDSGVRRGGRAAWC